MLFRSAAMDVLIYLVCERGCTDLSSKRLVVCRMRYVQRRIKSGSYDMINLFCFGFMLEYTHVLFLI